MEQYRHGGEIYDKKVTLDFSVNTNPLGLPEGVRTALITNTDSFSLYPDNKYTELKTALADYEKLDRDFIICGNGASDLIFRLCYAIKPKKAMVTAPAFSEYEKALREVDSSVVYYSLKEEEDFQVTGQLLNQLDKTLDLLFLCCPNNPTGSLINQELLKEIVEQCHNNDIFLVMDECFMDFTDEGDKYSLKRYLIDNDRIFILKAFTKFYAMAGIRLGYGLCGNRDLLKRISGIGPAWNVSVPAQIAGVNALKEISYRLESRELIKRERNYLYGGLCALGLKVFAPSANYIFFKGAQSLYEELLAKGILIRQCDNYVGLNKEFYRVAVKNHNENEILLKEIKEYLRLREGENKEVT